MTDFEKLAAALNKLHRDPDSGYPILIVFGDGSGYITNGKAINYAPIDKDSSTSVVSWDDLHHELDKILEINVQRTVTIDGQEYRLTPVES